MTQEKAQFIAKRIAFARAAQELLSAWENVEMGGEEVDIKGYPFKLSFDDLTSEICDWAGL